MKQCAKCGQAKPIDRFQVRSEGKRANRCRDCANEYLAAYRAACSSPESRAAFLADVAKRKSAKAEEARARKKAFRAEYEKRPHVVAYRTSYKAKAERRARTRDLQRRPEKRALRAARNRKLRATDPKFLLSGRMSCMINAKIRRGVKGGKSWKQLVDYTVDELRNHIERQFLPGMGWHNASEWHIDHIIPVSAFDYTSPDDPAFKRCWGLPNLRPLWGADNIRKSNRVVTLL